jgi:hypothetical protein
MAYENMTNVDLIRYVDNLPAATPMMRELANRLDAAEQKREASTFTEKSSRQTELFKEKK